MPKGGRHGVMLFIDATGISYLFRAIGGDDLMIGTLANLGSTAWKITVGRVEGLD